MSRPFDLNAVSSSIAASIANNTKESRFNIATEAEEVGSALADDIKGKTVLITGASQGGLGGEAARVIAKYASLVIVTARSQDKLDTVIAKIKAETPDANLRPLILDLGSLSSVKKAAAEVNAYSETINVLINNAAIMASPYAVTEDGFESQLGVNHLGPFLFTALIYPRILAAASQNSSARIVNVSSVGHLGSDFLFDDYDFSKGATYNRWAGYAQTKTANVLFANEIARRAKAKGLNLQAFSLHPGSIKTNLQIHVTLDDRKRFGAVNEKGEEVYPGKTLGAGSATYLVAAFDPSIKELSGAYLSDGRIAEEQRADHARSQESGEKLWELSEKLVGQKFEL